jgi:hypothetical protein
MDPDLNKNLQRWIGVEDNTTNRQNEFPQKNGERNDSRGTKLICKFQDKQH